MTSSSSSAAVLLAFISLSAGCRTAGVSDTGGGAQPASEHEDTGQATLQDGGAADTGEASTSTGDGGEEETGDGGESTEETRTWYIDQDEDGFGVAGSEDLDAVDQPDGYVDNDLDCDDSDGSVHPDAEELCDGIDNDCDGTVDVGAVDADTWYSDLDGDGYGDPDSAETACEQPEGTTDNDLDTDDADADAPGPMMGNWPQLGRGPTHTGHFPGTVGDATLSAAWTLEYGYANSQATVYRDTVYLSYVDDSATAWLSALDLSTGAEVWSYELPSDSFSLGPPTWYDDTILFQRCAGRHDTHIWGFDAASGSLLWRTAHGAQWEHYLAPTADDGRVFVNGGTYGGMYGFDSDDGDELFYASLEQYDGWSPAYADGVVYSYVEGYFRAHDPDSGEELWSLDLGWEWHGWSMDTAPTIDGGVAYVAGTTGLFAIDLAEHALLWEQSGEYSGLPTIADGMVYAYVDGAIERYAAADGSYDASYIPSTSNFNQQAVVTDDTLILPTRNTVELFDLATGDSLYELDVAGIVTVANQHLLIAGAESLEVLRWDFDDG